MSSRAVAADVAPKVYDEAYFAKWYHHPRTRVHSPDHVRRKVRMVVAVAEYFLRRTVRSVLDIGAGEGRWRAELRRLRPGITYQGIDPSEYVVRRHGQRRNIMLGAFQDLGHLRLAKSYDLIVCADVLQYIDDADLRVGLREIRERLAGVAFLEAYTSGDDMEGDLTNWHHRSKARYERVFRDAGLVRCGLHCHMTPQLSERAVELELR